MVTWNPLVDMYEIEDDDDKPNGACKCCGDPVDQGYYHCDPCNKHISSGQYPNHSNGRCPNQPGYTESEIF